MALITTNEIEQDSNKESEYMIESLMELGYSKEEAIEQANCIQLEFLIDQAMDERMN